jgi:Family of unknown function (DUF6356)
MFKVLFLDHPRSVGMSYTQHAFFAAGIALRLYFSSTAFVIHAIFPFIPVGNDFNLDGLTHFLLECQNHRTSEP